MKNEKNIDIRKNYIAILKNLEELINAASEIDSPEAEKFFKRALLLTRTGVLKIEHKITKKNN
tara:strand:+ start:370 stop:558 length:189 start_codon:yes stop_codon:yes gene_type:complete